MTRDLEEAIDQLMQNHDGALVLALRADGKFFIRNAGREEKTFKQTVAIAGHLVLHMEKQGFVLARDE